MSLDSRRWSAPWRAFCDKRAPFCGDSECRHPRRLWCRMRRRPLGVRLHGTWYCMPECFERAVAGLLRPPQSAQRRAAASRRIPLGLILLSRQQLVPEQLRSALDAQLAAGAGKIGQWLRHMDFITEPQLTSALARQWSCPVLRSRPAVPALQRVPEIPMLLLESLRMICASASVTSMTSVWPPSSRPPSSGSGGGPAGALRRPAWRDGCWVWRGAGIAVGLEKGGRVATCAEVSRRHGRPRHGSPGS